jgi:hypothetical protein
MKLEGRKLSLEIELMRLEGRKLSLEIELMRLEGRKHHDRRRRSNR